jgi:GNAT superfamily N-acetyltransferase
VIAIGSAVMTLLLRRVESSRAEKRRLGGLARCHFINNFLKMSSPSSYSLTCSLLPRIATQADLQALLDLYSNLSISHSPNLSSSIIYLIFQPNNSIQINAAVAIEFNLADSIAQLSALASPVEFLPFILSQAQSFVQHYSPRISILALNLSQLQNYEKLYEEFGFTAERLENTSNSVILRKKLQNPSISSSELDNRVATAEDAESISLLVNSGYRGEISKQGWTTEADLLGGIRTDSLQLSKMIATPDHYILLFHSKQSKELFASVLVEVNNTENSGYIGMFTVRPDLQARGYGKFVLQTAEQFLTNYEQGKLKKIEMTVVEQRPELIAYYIRRGYIFSGKKSPFPMSDPNFGLPKVQHLAFLHLEKIINQHN